MGRYRALGPARRQLTPGTPLTDRPATVEAERSPWWDDERAFVGARPRWSLIILAWLIPATIGLLQTTAGAVLRGEFAQDWPWALVQVPRWLTWALVTPLIFRAADRFPFRSDRLARSIWTHLLIAIAISTAIELVWLQITLVMQAYLEPQVLARARMNWAEVYSTVILSRLVSGAFTYGAVLGVATTLGYHRRFRERELRTAQLEAQLALAQVQALKMQVHPHFLFNTLHAITVLIREDPTSATRVVTRLGDLLRLTLSRATTAEVSFRRELEILRLYLEIERTRFHDRLEISYDVQPATLTALVPDLVLQPIVENAIRHGVSPKAGTGRIQVRSRRDGDWLTLEIRDNGAGLSQTRPRPDGIGLSTTRARLERLYGERQELTLENLPEGGCVARIRIPFQLTTDDRQDAPIDLSPQPNVAAPVAAAGD
jgi:two-component system, LytTR family, sensor kinase